MNDLEKLIRDAQDRLRGQPEQRQSSLWAVVGLVVLLTVFILLVAVLLASAPHQP